MTDKNKDYWGQYSNLQHVKHDLIENYLNGWFPKLGFWSGKILYFDTHAGRGKHEHGHLGSPLIALQTLLKHKSKDQILERCEVIFFFIEENEKNSDVLQKEIQSLGKLPKNIVIHNSHGNCFFLLTELINHLKESDKQFAPAFIFVDPFGFKVPGRLLKELMAFPRVELFINVIWRELNMAISQPDKAPGTIATLDEIFDGNSWNQLSQITDINLRSEYTVNLLKDMTGSRWPTWITMRGDNDVARYLLVHLTNHDAGRDLMKDCMWKVCPDGGFYARKNDDPNQQYLITPEPDLRPLREWVLSKLEKDSEMWSVLIDDLRSEIWRIPHLNKVLQSLRKEGVIEGVDYDGRFGPKANPTLRIKKQ